MIKSYFFTAWRNLVRNKTFSLINILGLTLGLASSLLMLLWVKDELNMDKFHLQDDRLYTVYERQYHDGQIDAGYYTPGLLAEEMKVTLPEVQYAAGMAWNELNTFEANGKILKKEGNSTGVDFFNIFSYTLLMGEPSTALKSPVDIAVSRKMAEDFFGSAEEAMGKSIRYQNRKDLKVSAVFDDVPNNSSPKFDYLINWETFLENNTWAKEWGNNGPAVYLVLRSDTDIPAFRKKIRSFIELYNKEENFRIELDIQRYSERYLHSNLETVKLLEGEFNMSDYSPLWLFSFY